jgi:hypothetical protein
MNRISKTGGLFARQKASRIREIASEAWRRIRRGMLLVSIAVFALSSCDKKTNGQVAQSETKDYATAAHDTVNKPKVNIQVNRRYDDKGNLIGFDSTYSSFYSNVKGDTAEMDSLMHSFDRYFSRNHSSFFDRQFNPLFFNDSLRYPDFFHKDFFMKRYELNDQYLRETMKSMDSIKNRFFKEHSKTGKDPNDL